jgi:uncharacterized protein YjbI with pentapeptide repeats
MANQEQLQILEKGVDAWNQWRRENPNAKIELGKVDLSRTELSRAFLSGADLSEANLSESDLSESNLNFTNLSRANLEGVDLSQASLGSANLSEAQLSGADLLDVFLGGANLNGAILIGSDFSQAHVGVTTFENVDLSECIGLGDVFHSSPSSISTNTFVRSKGKIPKAFLHGCGLSDWEIEAVKLYNPDLSNKEISDIQYRIYELRATQALQISPLFISYSRADRAFVDKVGHDLSQRGIRYWLDIHDMKAGRIEKQIDRAIRHNPTGLLVLSEYALSSDWVEHEVRTARELEKDLGRDVLCPVALDDSWKNSRWPQRLMEQIMEYNILDFSDWQNNSHFDSSFRKLINGLDLFYRK